jgi:menaquinone reductase, molybdopterin-binding-like subunit
MKVDRRSFLGLGLGAVAGVAVSPVGLKLTDDSSIWTQNWPWTPVPVDGKVNYKSSVCTLCPGGCGINVRRIENRPVKIEGLNGYPINDGGACLHGIAGLQYLYDPARIKTPLKKNGNKFEKISWDDAIKLVAGKLKDLRKKGSPEKLACIADKKQGSVSSLFQRLLKAYGSPEFYTMPSLESYLEIVASTLHGKDKTLAFDLENANFVLSFGAGIIEGWGSPVNCFKANASRKERHAKLYQIEPRLSNTAANADRWIPVNPGTEADLALGICAVILKNNLFDDTLAGNFSQGMNQFAALLKKSYSTQKTADITGVKKAEIEKMAILFTKAKKPVAVFGKGRGDGAQSLKEMAGVHMLNCLVGNINKKGGVFVKSVKPYLDFPKVSMDSVAKTGFDKKRSGKYVNQLFGEIEKSSQPVIEALFVYNANPSYTLHDAKKIRRILNKIPFIVSFSSFLDETAMQSDVILPSHTFMERFEDVPSNSGLAKSVVGLTKPIVKPLYNTKNPGDAVILIAKALKGNIALSFEWENYYHCLKSATPRIWKSLSKRGFAVTSKNAPSGRPLIDPSFLASNPATIKALGDYDLTLIPIDNMRLISTGVASSPFAVKTVSDRVLKGNDIVVEINPQTAGGLKDKELAVLATPIGEVRVKVNLNHGMMPGVIGMVTGLGHTFDNQYVSGKGVNINDLIGQVIEPDSGLDAAFGIKAKLSKA